MSGAFGKFMDICDGVRKLGDSTQATLQDRWYLGSCTKAMTATLIAALVERGAMKWETTIEAALPDLAADIRTEYRSVTVEQLLAHRGGIRHELDVPGLWAALWKRKGTPTEQRRRMAKTMLAQEPRLPIGEYFYSNFGYGIAGLMAETMTGKSWEQLMRDVVFAPLDMQSAGFGVPWEGEPPTDPWPHVKDGNPVTLVDIETHEEIFSQPFAIQKSYREAMKEFLHTYKTECRKNNIDYVLMSTETPFDVALLGYLNKRKKIH